MRLRSSTVPALRSRFEQPAVQVRVGQRLRNASISSAARKGGQSRERRRDGVGGTAIPAPELPHGGGEAFPANRGGIREFRSPDRRISGTPICLFDD